MDFEMTPATPANITTAATASAAATAAATTATTTTAAATATPAENFGPVICPHNATSPDTCWANGAWQMCPVDRQGAYDKVMAKRGDQTVRPTLYNVDLMGP